jgi:hypothetical protein
MKSVLCLMMLGVSLISAETLDDFKWKKRILVVTRSNAELEQVLKADHSGLGERDLEVFVLDGEPEVGKSPEPALAKELRTRLKVNDEIAEVLLLGKDGRTTLRWKLADFTTAKLFAAIDAMPMRKQEMKRQ